MQKDLLKKQSTWMGRAIYEIYPRTFFDSNGDGVGDIAGITAKLPYLKDTGFRAVWLTPFYPHGGVDGGYDIRDHKGVGPQFGTIEDMKRLIEQAHKLDIKVIVDFVPNHTSDKHPWFKQSCEGPDGPFSDYYIWVDPKKRGPNDLEMPDNIVAEDRLAGMPKEYTVPNNWTSIFSIPEREKLKEQYGGTIPKGVKVPAVTAWVWHPGRQQFYLAEFTKEQPSLKWANPAVRKAQTDVLHFWLGNGVDGSRFDVLNHIGKDPEFTDEELVPEGRFDPNNDNPHDQWTQKHMVSHEPSLELYVPQILAVADKYPDRSIRFTHEDWIVALNGGINADNLSRLRPELGTAFNFARLLQTNKEGWKAAIHKRLLDTYHMAFITDPDLFGGVPNEVVSNHDVDRVVTRLGWPASRAAALIMLTTPGTPCVYQGEEGGFPNVSYEDIPPHMRKDEGIGLRDGERCPMMWNRGKNAGFSDAPEDILWLPVDPNHPELNLEDQAKDPRSFYSLYRALLHMRNSSIELSHSGYNPMETDHEDVLAFGRPHPEEHRQYITLANFSETEVEVAILNPQQNQARIAISSETVLTEDRSKIIRLDQGRIRLRPYEALLLEPVV
jgi:alpha-glucosidase